MTCYNRVEKTLKCLNNIYKASIPENYTFDIYLVDDNSPDKTGNIVKEKYPDINIILGTGSLYWNRGMRLAWKNASKHYDYDFYLWINDDTFINTEAMKIVISDYYYLLNKGIEAIISGVCQSSNSSEITYGGSDEKFNLIISNGMPKSCKYINGNFTLVSKNIFHKTKYLSYKYTHSGGDYDYGLKATKHGFKCYISSTVLAICDGHVEEEDWLSHELLLNKRIKKLFTIKGWDYLFFVIENYGFINALKRIVRGFLRALFPALIKRKN